MDKIFQTNTCQYDMELNLEIAFCSLFQAYQSNDRDKMINAYVSMNRFGQQFITNKIFPSIQNTFISNGCLYPYSVNLRDITDIKELRLNILGCMQAVQDEIDQRQFYVLNHRYVQQVLYNRGNRVFSYDEVLYAKQGETLKVADLLKALRYSISIAEVFEPNNESYEYASAALTALQSIDAVLNNRPEDKPMNKMLHLATSFISSVEKSSLTNAQDKRNVTITSMMLDMTIDFLYQ